MAYLMDRGNGRVPAKMVRRCWARRWRKDHTTVDVLDVCTLPAGHDGEHQDHRSAGITGEIWCWL